MFYLINVSAAWTMLGEEKSNFADFLVIYSRLTTFAFIRE